MGSDLNIADNCASFRVHKKCHRVCERVKVKQLPRVMTSPRETAIIILNASSIQKRQMKRKSLFTVGGRTDPGLLRGGASVSVILQRFPRLYRHRVVAQDGDISRQMLGLEGLGATTQGTYVAQAKTHYTQSVISVTNLYF